MPIFAVDKPLGLSSHDVVARGRRLLGTRRVGHAGTLDPLATGVLVLLADEATKLSPFLTGSDKEYLAWIAFGAATATLDAEGPVTDRGSAAGLHTADVRDALRPFLAVTEQHPPAFSAIQRGGERSYRRARRGEEVALPARPAGYRWLRLVAFEADRRALPVRFAPSPADGWDADDEGRLPALPPPLLEAPTAIVALRVRAGTYVRAFARDLGAALGVPAHLAGLLRTQAGRVGLEDAVPLERLGSGPTLLASDLLPYPVVQLDDDAARRVRLGQRPALDTEGRVQLLDPAGRLVAVAERQGDRTRLLRVWPGSGPG